MHPEVTSDKPDRCPKCGMKLVPAELVGRRAHGTGTATHHESTTTAMEHGTRHGHGHQHGEPDTPTTGHRASSGKTTWPRSTG